MEVAVDCFAKPGKKKKKAQDWLSAGGQVQEVVE